MINQHYQVREYFSSVSEISFMVAGKFFLNILGVIKIISMKSDSEI